MDLFDGDCEHEFNEETCRWEASANGQKAVIVRMKCSKCGEEFDMTPEELSAYRDVMKRSQ